jgi:peptide/nickel transport system permease protein
MIRFIIRRTLLLIVTLLITSVIVFGLTQLLPGDIATLNTSRDASEEIKEQFRELHGLNDPVPMQYLNWLSGFLSGDWGKSFNRGNPDVRPIVLDRLSNTLRLGILVLLMSVPTSIILGTLAALYEDSWLDSVISIFSLSVVGLPEFVTGIVLINVFAIGLGWLPATASILPEGNNLLDWLEVLILPALTATLVLLAYIARMTRAGVIDELKKPYVRTATLKGLPQRQIIFKHVLRNALLPTITVIAISIGWLIGGLVVIEQVFNYPGLGRELINAVKSQNIPLMQAIVMLIIFTYAVANLVADILYGVLNPRIRLE